MAIVSTSVFTTSDGKKFNDLAEAEAHQFALDNKDRIEAYLDATPGLQKAAEGQKQSAHRTLALNTIAGFLAFEAKVAAEAAE